eukprot:COSAG01_NODE_9639_length_2382_cov_6.634253_3_plen_54_part_00
MVSRSSLPAPQGRNPQVLAGKSMVSTTGPTVGRASSSVRSAAKSEKRLLCPGR